jgi:TfoX/Sxy family transcriptional regulator of competence genes
VARTKRKKQSTDKQSAIDELFAFVVEETLKDPSVTQSKMFGSRGLRIGGKVFAMLYKGKLVVKVSQERVKALIASGDGKRFDPGHGRVMKEWVAIKPLSKSEWLDLANEAKDFVASGL